MSCPTNEPGVDFSVLCTPKIDEAIRNPLHSFFFEIEQIFCSSICYYNNNPQKNASIYSESIRKIASARLSFCSCRALAL